MIRIDRKKIIESMRRSLGRTEFRVGLFAIIPVALIVMVILVNLGYSLASSTIDVYVKVNSITSLQKGTPVQAGQALIELD